MNHRDERLGSAPLGKLMFSLALPSVAAQLINVLYNIVDRMYIGHIPGYGNVALTGVGVTFPILTMISAFSAFAGMGGLANIVEKAMGSIAKSGTSPIVEVLSPAEKPTKHGLIFAATPASDIVCGPSQVASGIGLQVFMTGRGMILI